MIDPFMLSMIAAQLYPAVESWGEKDQAEGAVDAAARILTSAIKKADELNGGDPPAKQDGPPGDYGAPPVFSFQLPR